MADHPFSTAAALCPAAEPSETSTDPLSFETAISGIDGGSPSIARLKAHIRLVALDALVTVLILGESGTGKERVARAIHRASRRHRAPFVVVNCAGLSSTLIEDELFGHVRGAFTGAVADREGPFEYAHGGTVFLDEIGELSLRLQLKLLRALQERTVQRLGSRKETPFDVQVLAATNVDLARATSDGRFREDLYYRLRVYELEVPSLRKRGVEDLRSLAEAIVRRLAEQRRRPVPALDIEVFDRFLHYPWPGNVRELENTLERMLVAAGGSTVLTVQHLPTTFGLPSRANPETRSIGGFPTPRAEVPTIAQIREALERNGHSRERAAADLGVSRHQLYRSLRRAGTNPHSPVA